MTPYAKSFMPIGFLNSYSSLSIYLKITSCLDKVTKTLGFNANVHVLNSPNS